MLRSMTGYGKSEYLVPGKKISVEIKSLNSKQTEILVKIPTYYREKEMEIRNLLGQALIRGKIDFSLFVETTEEITGSTINSELVSSYFEVMRKIADKYALPISDTLLQTALRMPDAIIMPREELSDEEWKGLSRATQEALQQLDSFRIQEGGAMTTDIRSRIEKIKKNIEKIEQYEDDRKSRFREKLIRNLNESGVNQIDENRFEQELIYYLEKLDISEEKTRLHSHCSYFAETMEQDDYPGKKLGFISQEIGREINTLGSKASHSDIQRIVIEMKDDLEKVKEQLMNIL